MSCKKWIEISVMTTSEAIEPISSIFYGLNVKGVAIEDSNDISTRNQGKLKWDFANIDIFKYDDNVAVIKGYFSEEENIEEIISYINFKIEELKKFDIDIGEGKIICKNTYEEDWANNWKKYYKPIKVGKDIVIKPTWEEYICKKGEKVIEIDPGMAFGTGTHETTEMCIQSLEKYIHKDSIVFDIGTGSGILAITAGKLGAKKVIGVDLDSVAVSTAIENVKINNSFKNIEIVHGNLMEVVNGKADIIISNIIAEVIISFTEDVKKYLNQGGYFIASGIIKDKKKDVLNKLEYCGFNIIEVNTLGEWVCIVSQYGKKEI